MNKKSADITAIVCLLIAIITGFMLHVDVHHKHVYDNIFLWRIHEISGILMAATIVCHCIQHKFWFKNYRRIPKSGKRVTTILLAILVIPFITGILLMFGSQSKEVSITHYATAIAATLLAIGHVCKRWKIFISLFRK